MDAKGVPSLVILISLIVQANPARLFKTMSKRILGERRKTVAFHAKRERNCQPSSDRLARPASPILHRLFGISELAEQRRYQ